MGLYGLRRLLLLGRFAGEIAARVDTHENEAILLKHRAHTLRALLRDQDWLPAAYAQPDAQRYRQCASLPNLWDLSKETQS